VPERDLEDKVHDVFLVAHRRRESYDPARPLRAWLAGISVRVAMDHRRLACQRREVARETIEAVDERRGPEAAFAQRQARELVAGALDELPEEQRIVFVLREIEGFSMPEIAAMVEAPLNTLYSRLRLGRERFCAAIRRRQRPHAGEP
jgi:RNA polymerase sigma-70 factor (ECF subfamily)